MAPTKILARDWVFEFNTGTDAVPTWVEIKGINSFSVDNSKNDADTTDFDSGGWAEHLVASRGMVVTLEGFRLEDSSDGTRDPGQEAVEGLADNIGPSSVGSFRIYYDLSNKGKSFKATANVTGPGGGNDDAAAWAVELTVTGAPTDITVTP